MAWCYAVDYLTSSTKSVLSGACTPAISAEGKDVVVIGGGDTGTDCMATALRQGAKSIQQLEYNAASARDAHCRPISGPNGPS